jgi:hypothetical protein
MPKTLPGMKMRTILRLRKPEKIVKILVHGGEKA